MHAIHRDTHVIIPDVIGPPPAPAGAALPDRLRGRRRECEALEQLVTNARAGQSQVLVLRGEAGVGKTALLGYLQERSPGCHIARVAGVDSEMELSFAGLHQLCAPFLARLERLPGPQRDAMGTAFSLQDGDPPDRFASGLATLNLLSGLAEERPLLCVVDNAQWLDRASLQTLTFVTRRLVTKRIAVIFAVREPGDPRDLTGLAELTVSGLADPDARALLGSVVPGPLDARVRDRIAGEARGNPRALLDLAHEVTPAELAGGFGLPSAAVLPGRVEEGFRQGRSANETGTADTGIAAEPMSPAPYAP